MKDIITCKTQIKGIIKSVVKLEKKGITYTDEWLTAYIEDWFEVPKVKRPYRKKNKK